MTTQIVARPTQRPTQTNSLVAELMAIDSDSAIVVDVSGEKFVNFHSRLYKKLRTLGLDLHYRLVGVTCTLWVTPR